MSNLLDNLVSQEERESNARRINGVVVGIVTNNTDPEGLGRLKVTFPWLSDDNESDWARLSTPMGGANKGFFILPEVGDEVLVAFEQGDINRPFVIGSLWNEEGKPAEDNADGENNIKKISTRNGHEVTFGEKDGEEKIEVKSKSGHKLLLDDSSGGEKITIVDKTGSNSIEIDSNQNSVSINAQMKIVVKASTDIEISSDANLKLKSGGLMSIEATGPLTLKGAIINLN